MKITSLTVPSPLFGIINLHVLIKCAPFVDLHVTATCQYTVCGGKHADVQTLWDSALQN